MVVVVVVQEEGGGRQEGGRGCLQARRRSSRAPAGEEEGVCALDAGRAMVVWGLGSGGGRDGANGLWHLTKSRFRRKPAPIGVPAANRPLSSRRTRDLLCWARARTPLRPCPHPPPALLLVLCPQCYVHEQVGLTDAAIRAYQRAVEHNDPDGIAVHKLVRRRRWGGGAREG